jgi:hypothetical protein
MFLTISLKSRKEGRERAKERVRKEENRLM